MAKQLKPDNAPTNGGIAASDLKRVVSDIKRHKENASEHSGLAGQAAKQAIDRYKLDRKGLSFVVGLSKRETVEAQASLRATIDYADKLGMFDQVDAFDDLIPIMERIVERARNTQPPHGVPSGRDNPVADLVGATVQ